MPVPVSMQGTAAFSTQARISPAPPRGISRSTSPRALHDIVGALVGGVLHDVHDVGIASGGGDARLQRRHDGAAGAVRLLPASEHADVAGS